MTADEVLQELAALGSEQTKKTFLRHGAREPLFGVKVGDLKKIQKRIKVDYQLALDLYATGNSDAMYLAGLIADDARMTRQDLQRWVKQAYWHMLSGCTVPWVATGSRFGAELARKWIDSKDEQIVSAGWSTWSSLLMTKPDDELDLAELQALLERVATTIHAQPNRVRYCMNAFVIAAGSGVVSLTAAALRTAKAMGPVEVDMGDTACQTPDAAAYIAKVKAHGSLGKKRKSAKC